MEGRRLDDFLEALQRRHTAGFDAPVTTFGQVARTLGLCLDLDSWAQLREELLLNKELLGVRSRGLPPCFGQPNFVGPGASFGLARADHFADRLCNSASAVFLALHQLSDRLLFELFHYSFSATIKTLRCSPIHEPELYRETLQSIISG